ncbi:hypothetical protein [Pseudemcibacter aquimaris]|uniref:hypothetical protein n=1 Tax=Pseudemcibacter aquimaris TaxID=2857064 RepID=UPI0020134437|nr:hypothetical protein [Pseudemcibacter aquimaris]MCC3859833.1 hypothetical protein [Pseudemcibacter aquimaris]WDU57165.1 hypothetical protein KW060_08140 [Pseudemcibacter aquimaris]
MEKIEEYLTRKGYLSSVLQMTLVYIILDIPYYFQNILYNITGHMVFTENIIFSLTIVAIIAAYYVFLFLKVPSYMGYIKDRNEVKYAAIAYFTIMILLVLLPTIWAVYSDISYHSSRTPIAGFDIKVQSVLNNSYAVSAIFCIPAKTIILGSISFRFIFGKYKYNNSHRERSVDDLKAVLSPAALKAYENKESD